MLERWSRRLRVPQSHGIKLLSAPHFFNPRSLTVNGLRGSCVRSHQRFLRGVASAGGCFNMSSPSKISHQYYIDTSDLVPF